jgi:hypothetical protein
MENERMVRFFALGFMGGIPHEVTPATFIAGITAKSRDYRRKTLRVT